jgi:hypothetical protein
MQTRFPLFQGVSPFYGSPSSNKVYNILYYNETVLLGARVVTWGYNGNSR